MLDGVTMKVHGLKELDRDLRALGPKIARKALRAAVNAGAQPIKKEAKARAPRLTGKLAKKAIYVKRVKEKGSRTKETYIVSVRSGSRERKKGRDAFYWWFHEFGTRFMAATPFLVPAFETKKHEAFERIRAKLREKIKQLAPLK